MIDLAYLIFALTFFALAYAYVRVCEKLEVPK